ncbi:hypothetical protein CJ030_MR8G018188 [Morella rubra]|uniref:Uncharacterized protein n=1 Tax=Morella rubra TaxID=262757 RepID=A0A6A1UNV1_9ROSI|nr:hypothetical protein CJ030_MR8G018188 [Morella rubra]
MGGPPPPVSVWVVVRGPPPIPQPMPLPGMDEPSELSHQRWRGIPLHYKRLGSPHDELWMPLVSDLTVAVSTPPMVLPPLDIKWVWFCHTLNPCVLLNGYMLLSVQFL